MIPLMRLSFLWAVLLLCIQPLAWAAELVSDADYVLGKGWQVPGTGFRLGGYASVGIEDERHAKAAAGVDDLSLLIHWEGDGKLRFFSELDLERAVIWEQDTGITARHAYLALERLYGDYLYSDKLNFRAGKFLTPIGRWNVIHAAPLVWTMTRPLLTEHSFPTNATGAMAYGTLSVLGTELDYSVYTELSKNWRSDPKQDPFEEAYGGHVMAPIAGGELGVSYANFEQKGSVGERKNLLGLDYFWSRNRYEISAEAIYRFSDRGSQSDEKGVYIQGVAPLSDRWYAVGRYEYYDQAGAAPALNLWLAGVAMRLSPAMILKAEYSHANHNHIQAPEGVFASFAVLF